MKNILSFDIEEWFQTIHMEERFPFEVWGKCQSRLTIGIDKILNFLSKKNIKATFFILGWLAERYPEIIKKINDAGNEIASHGYAHRSIYRQTTDEFRKDVRKSIEILRSIVNKDILGFRAPNYSITKQSLWALDILKEEGIRYDSSIYPARRYVPGGMPTAEFSPHFIKDNLFEFPLGVFTILGYRFPVASGAYFRLYPYKFTRWAIKNMNEKGIPIMVNIHPWELDPFQPVQNINIFHKIRQYTTLRQTEIKLRMLLEDFEFVTAKEKMDEILGKK